MKFDEPESFSYDNCTGYFGGNMELCWIIKFSFYELKIITKVIDGQVNLSYLKYLIRKGAKFIDDPKHPLQEVFGGYNPELVELLCSE